MLILFFPHRRYLSSELAHYARVAQSTTTDPKAAESIRHLLSRLGALMPHLVPTEALMMRPSLSYSDLKNSNVFAQEDGSLGGIAGMEVSFHPSHVHQHAFVLTWWLFQANVLPACLAATLPVFLRRDGMYNRAYRNPNAVHERSIVSDSEATHLRNICIEASRRVDPAFSVALVRGEKLRQMLEFMGAGNWDGLRRWEMDVRRELGLVGR